MDTWINSTEAASSLSTNAGRHIGPAYVRVLARANRIRSKKFDTRTNVYNQKDCENMIVAPHQGQRVAERVRDRRTGRPVGRPRKDKDKQEQERD